MRQRGRSNAPARHPSPGGALRVTASSGHPSPRHRYASREVLLGPVECQPEPMQGSCSAMASAVNVAAVDRLTVLIEPLWGQYAFFHSLIESRLHRWSSFRSLMRMSASMSVSCNGMGMYRNRCLRRSR